MASPYQFQSGAGGGSSSPSAGGVNYLANLYDGTTVTGINNYNNGASAVPTTGTGTSGGAVAGLTTTLNTTTPLNNVSNQRFSKDAANRQGMGWSYEMVAQRGDYQRSATAVETFIFKTSANYVSGDLRAFVYDKDTSVLLNVLSLNGDGSLVSATSGAPYTGSFSLGPASDDYRVIWHITSTNVLAWDVDICRISIGPDLVVPGAIISNPQSFAPTGTWTTNTTYSGTYQRFGDWARIQVQVSLTGAPNNVSLVLNMPSGLTIDSSKLPGFGTGGKQISCTGALFKPGNALNSVSMFYASSTTIAVNSLLTGNATTNYVGNAGNVNATTPFTFANGDSVNVIFEVPIVSWAASASLSTTETLLRSARASYMSTAGQSIPNATQTIIDFSIKNFDTNSNVTTGAGWRFTAPAAMTVFVNAKAFLASATTLTAGEQFILNLYKNGVAVTELGRFMGTGTPNATAGGPTTIALAQGDYIDVRAYQDSGGTLSLLNAGGYNYIDIFAIPDFSVFSVYGNFEVLTCASSAKTPGATDRYLAMTGNSIALNVGTFELSSIITFLDSGSPAGYSQIYGGYYAANGADTSAEPAALSTVCTVLSAGETGRPGSAQIQFPTAALPARLPLGKVIIRVTTPTTVYFVPYASQVTSANARITAYGTAERKQ